MEIIASILNKGTPVFKDSIIDLYLEQEVNHNYELNYDETLNENLKELGFVKKIKE